MSFNTVIPAIDINFFGLKKLEITPTNRHLPLIACIRYLGQHSKPSKLLDIEVLSLIRFECTRTVRISLASGRGIDNQ